MKVTFWSPVHGRSGTTSNLFAIAVIMAWQLKKKVLLINGQYNRMDLENAILHAHEEGKELLESTGIDCLIRNSKMRVLDKKTIESSTLSFYSNQLQVITGTTKENKNIFEDDLLQNYSSIISAAEEAYDIILVDAPSGSNKSSEIMLKLSDLNVINLPQNRNTINDFFNKYPSQLKKSMFLIGNYSDNSKYNLKNLQRAYKFMKNNIGVIPYNTGFKDAFSDAEGIKFMQKMDLVTEKQFFLPVLNSAELILKRGEKT